MNRPCPFPYPHNLDASFLTYPSGLGRRGCSPKSHFTVPVLQQHALGLVHYRSCSVQLLCPEPPKRGPELPDVAALQHLLPAVSDWDWQRDGHDFQGERGVGKEVAVAVFGGFTGLCSWFVLYILSVCGEGLLAEIALGSYVMYTHMMTQRRKIMRGKGPERRQ